MTEHAFEGHLDERYLVDTLVELLRVDCSVPLGPETLIEPEHPKLVHYVQEVLRPKLVDIGLHELVDLPKGQLGARFGAGETDESLLLMAYTPVQHYNLMEEPLSGKIAVPEGVGEPCAFGQGASQNKAHFAALLTMLKAFVDSGTELSGTLHVVANNEGRSSHECSRALLPQLDPRPDGGVVLFGGSNQLWVGNRGRVDVLVHIYGEVAHSSTPDHEANAILGATEAINRLRAMEFPGEHPQLGGRHAVPYQVTYEPVAPHTFPGYARIKVDRRLLPGDNPDDAAAEIREAIGELEPFTVEVERDVFMEPSLVDPDDPVVRGLQGAIRSLDGEEAEEGYWDGAYDAGGPTNVGIPSVTYGRPVHNAGSVVGTDYVSLAGVQEEARILGRMAVDMLG